MVSGLRLMGKFSSVDTQPERADVRFEGDTHASTCAVVKVCYIKRSLDCSCISKPFMDSY